ncbi:MAG: multiheme c-type cytochrome [Verrucomicrobiota bacterium]
MKALVGRISVFGRVGESELERSRPLSGLLRRPGRRSAASLPGKRAVALAICALAAGAARPANAAVAAAPPVSKETQQCLDCHTVYTPALVQDWMHSLHSQTTPQDALKKRPLERRMSSTNIPESLSGVVVGCYECHGLNATNHTDNFDHFDLHINVVVSPPDCQICHEVEAQQFAGSKKAHALGNLDSNPLFHTLVESITSVAEIRDGKVAPVGSSDLTKDETCYGCHGSRVRVVGTRKLDTELGEVVLPRLTNWPNQGVGRVNPDGSRGACTACHPRHEFSIEVARKPFTCSQCHRGPDVPAWEVYEESKHGNIFNSKAQEWNWDRVPWRVGQDFRAPTCAACHNSLLTAGDVVAPRTHDFGARLWVRLFGLPCTHPQPKSGDTSLIRNKAGQPLPTTFAGEPAAEFLIDATEQTRRQAVMVGVCRSCHNRDWADGHFAKLASTIQETDRMTRSATDLMQRAWDLGLADKTNPFDETIERQWLRQWLFYADSIRLSSAMIGPDHASFEDGWFDMTTHLREMQEWIDAKEKSK